MRIFIDTNVVLDIFIKERALSFPDSLKAVAGALENDVDLIISAASITDIFYVLRKSYRSPELAMGDIKKTCRIMTVADTCCCDIEAARKSGFSDFEDGVAAATACRTGCGFILTRNTCDFAESTVKAVTPTELLTMM